MADLFWERRRLNEPTADYLGRVLDQLGLARLARKARDCHYDDYFAPRDVASGFELINLVNDLKEEKRKLGPRRRWEIDQVIAAVKEGEFDGTLEESRRWAASKDGKEALDQLGPVADALGLRPEGRP